MKIPKKSIEKICKKWGIKNFSLFGSILRQDFSADSDIDILVQFSKDNDYGLLEYVKIKEELREILGREIDLVTKRSLEQSKNWIRKQEILETAETIYES